jgi:hypothetical protein
MNDYFKYLIALIFLYGINQQILSQSDTIEHSFQSFQEILVEIAERTGNENATDELADILLELTSSPIPINFATRVELEKLFWLNEKQISNITGYIAKYGQIQTLQELYYIEDLTAVDVNLLKPFITIDKKENNKNLQLKRIFSNPSQRLIFRLQRVIEKQDGFLPKETPTNSNHFTGDPWRLYTKYQLHFANKIHAGFTAEKDPGEEFFKGSNAKNFDFTSWHVQLNDLKFIKTLILGDYRVNFGQGLISWTGFNFGKSTSVYSAEKRSLNLNRYTSTDENFYFKGIATTMQWKPIELTVFYSSNKMDGNITIFDTIQTVPLEISSLQTTGTHATPGEIADENACRIASTGANIKLRKTYFEIGLSTLYYKLNCNLNPTLEPYNLYYFRGKSNANASIDYKIRFKNVLLFGEEAISENRGKAFLNGLQAFGGNKFGLSIVHRYYERNYQALFSNAFGENSNTQNEEGLYAGFEFVPLKFVSLSAYADLFHFPWLKYGADMPSSGKEYSGQIKVTPNDRWNTYLQYRFKQKEENFGAANDGKNVLISTTNQRWRAYSQYRVNDNIRMQNRVEFTHYNKDSAGNSAGFLISQDIEFSLNKLPLKFYFRYAIFDTRDYDSRIYTYENDLLYTFNIPSFYNEGTRSFAMVKYTPSRGLDIWLKYSLTRYSNKETISSGVYEIAGNRKSEIKMQVLVRF